MNYKIIKLILCFGILAAINTSVYSQLKAASANDAGANTVLLKNRSRMIPLKALENRKIASINTGSEYSITFDSLLKKYAAVKSFVSADYRSDSTDIDDLSGDLKYYNTLIVQVTSQSLNDPEIIRFITDNQKRKEVIIAGFGDLNSLKNLDDVIGPVVWSTDYSGASAGHTAQLIFGGVATTNKLKKTISRRYRSRYGYSTVKTRLRYSSPESAGINSSDLDSIDTIVAQAIREKATPSSVIMVIKDGSVIFNKAYGTHTYDGTQPTRVSDIYDMASLTKVSATTMSVMKLYDQQKINLDRTIGEYLPMARKTNKNDIKVREVLAHQSGLTAVGFHNKIKPEDHSSDSSYAFPVKVAENYFLRRNYFEEKMWPALLKAPIRNRGSYLYTDMNMYVMKEIVEWQSGIPMDLYVQNQFYKPLGMYTAGFTPRRRFEKEQIVPTQNDERFRKSLLHGYVHDEGAAMLGGVSGHAGLFASANDLGILYQMMLNRGTYGGRQYLKPQTVDLFTAKQSAVSRRGLGFDRWDSDTAKAYPSRLASPETFGHTGYTGISVWADPKYKLIYIFLSNRVHPQVTDKLYELKIRDRIQDVIYRAIEKKQVVSCGL